MALTVKIKSETDIEIVLRVTRVDQRVAVTPVVADRAGQELPKIRPGRSRRRSLFIISGKATQAEKDSIEAASKNWWMLGTGAMMGRVRFFWGENNGGNPYACSIMKVDMWKESNKEKYEFLIELEEGAF